MKKHLMQNKGILNNKSVKFVKNSNEFISGYINGFADAANYIRKATKDGILKIE